MLGHFSADIGWFSTVSLSVDKGKDVIGGKFYKGLLITCGFVLCGTGIYFILEYLPRIISI